MRAKIPGTYVRTTYQYLVLQSGIQNKKNCGGKPSLERENSKTVVVALFLVYFLTMASQTGREIMNSEVAGSILTVFPAKKRRKGIFSSSRTCKNSTWFTYYCSYNDESNTVRSLQVTPIPKKSEVKLDTWYWVSHRDS